jgi:hypothetical protein
MNITGGGKVTLNPKVLEERIALHVLAGLTDNDRLKEHISPLAEKKSIGKLDVTSVEHEEDWYRRSLLDLFYKNQNALQVEAIVFKYLKEEV